MNQLETLYEKEWKNIIGNIDYNLFLHSNDIATNKYFSELLGNQEIKITNYSFQEKTKSLN